MGIAVGIDLGTTNSVLAHINAHGQPAVVPNAWGEATTPSAVWFSDDGPVVGVEAKERRAAGDPRATDLFKRHMGEEAFAFVADGRSYSAADLSAILLEQMKQDAETELGGTITDAVITCPAYFKNPQREATIAAGRKAGLHVTEIINEPTAAAFAYGFKTAVGDRTLLVYDLGGGTFDVTLLRFAGGEGHVLASDGDHRLGGADWDERVVAYLASAFRDEFGGDPQTDGESRALLLKEAEQAKKRLSALETVQISVTHDGRQGSYALDRTTFALLTADLMDRTVSFAHHVLDSQRLAASDVDAVLLVGGSSRMRMVHDFVVREFGRPPASGVNVDEAVALGAAIKAGERMEILAPPRFSLGGIARIVDVTNHSLGVIAETADRSAYINRIILKKNLPIPCEQAEPFQKRTRQQGENVTEIYLTQGETTSPADVSYLGKYVAHDIPHDPSGPARIEITYHYDVSGTVDVAARLQATGAPLRITVEPLPPDVPARFLRKPEDEVVVQPITVYLAFDLSGSMCGAPMTQAQKAAHGFLAQSNLGACSLGIIAFSDDVRPKLQASQNAAQIKNAIDKLSCGETGGGNMGHPFDEALRLLQDVEGRRYLVTLADGVWYNQDLAVKRAKACHQAGIEVIAIGFGGADEAFLRRIASSDDVSFFTSMGGLVETFSNIAQVLSEGGAFTLDASRPADRD